MCAVDGHRSARLLSASRTGNNNNELAFTDIIDFMPVGGVRSGLSRARAESGVAAGCADAAAYGSARERGFYPARD